MVNLGSPQLSVIVPTRNRASSLPQALDSLALSAAQQPGVEIIVVDNGSTDATPSILDAWQCAPDRVRLRVEQPGRSRAVNAGMRAARALILAFTDDDVEVAPTWMQEIVRFFVEHEEYHAAMGRVLMPPEVTDPELIERVRWFGTLPFFEAGERVCDLPEMYGCNMAVRRAVIDEIGGFDERLGVGASGLGEDTDLSERILRAGWRIGYMPKAVVYHAVETSRLSMEFYRRYHLQKARSVFLMDPKRTRHRNVSRLIEATLRYGLASLTGDQRRKLRAVAKLIRHSEYLRLHWRARRSDT